MVANAALHSPLEGEVIIDVLLAMVPVIIVLTLVPGWIRRRRGTGDESFAEYRETNDKVQGDQIEAARDFIDFRDNDNMR